MILWCIYIIYIKLNYPLASGHCSCIPQRMMHANSGPATKLKPRVAVAITKMANLGNYRWDGIRLETKWDRITPTFPEWVSWWSMKDFLGNCCMVWDRMPVRLSHIHKDRKRDILEKFQPHAVSQMDMKKNNNQTTGKRWILGDLYTCFVERFPLHLRLLTLNLYGHTATAAFFEKNGWFKGMPKKHFFNTNWQIFVKGNIYRPTTRFKKMQAGYT